MNVFYFSSNLFVHAAATSIVSLMENNKTMDTIHFYVVDDGIEEINREKLKNMVEEYGRYIDFIDAPDPCASLGFPFKDRYQMGHSYMRMCIGSLLPESVDRVLCLDSDTLITDDLTDLWSMDMQGNILAGVADCMNLKAYRKQFKLSEKDIYCNAGVFLVDLQKWREERIEEEISKIINIEKGNVFFFEQTLINLSCKGKVLRLDPKYNCYTLFWAFRYRNLIRLRRPTSFYSEDEVERAKNKPAIIHFTRNFYMKSRPWVKNCDHPMTDDYIKYKKLTPWTELGKDDISIVKKFKHKLWHLIPQNLLSALAGFLYNNIRPKMWWKNE